MHYRWTDRWIEGRTDEQTDDWMDRQLDRQTDEWTDEKALFHRIPFSKAKKQIQKKKYFEIPS